MKILVFILLCPLFGLTQSYVPLIDQDSTSVWKDYFESIHFQNTGWLQKSENVYTISEDTILNGQNYAALSRSSRVGSYPIPGQGSGTGYTNYYNVEFEGAIREDGKQIFFWDKNDESEHLIYDFNLGIGDTVPAPSLDYVPPNGIIEAVDSVLIGGSYRKRYHIVDFNGFAADMDSIFLIEGIGSTAGFLLHGEFVFQVFESQTRLSCYKEYGSVLYSNALFTPTECITENLSVEKLDLVNMPFTISQNPVQTGSTISINYQYAPPLDIRIMNVHSQIVKTIRLEKEQNPLEVSFPAGVYFLISNDGNANQRLVVY